ncbi:MAG: hypothetical protein C0469_00450 [Cyanobacteria bacterium DS2.3.42]|nr:hypothetical protein [Cyanobacteria bacterium DS2.3.42]
MGPGGEICRGFEGAGGDFLGALGWLEWPAFFLELCGAFRQLSLLGCPVLLALSSVILMPPLVVSKSGVDAASEVSALASFWGKVKTKR